MYSICDIIHSYEKAKGCAYNRPFRLTNPDNIEKKLSKLKPHVREAIETFARQLNTTHVNIDLDRWMKYGFELWKGFTYVQLSNEKLLLFYIQKDKNLKRLDEEIENSVKKSTIFILKYCNDNNLTLAEYCRMRDENLLLVAHHFLKGYIDKYIVTFLILQLYVRISNEDKQYLLRVVDNFRKIKYQISEKEQFFEDIKKFLNSYIKKKVV